MSFHVNPNSPLAAEAAQQVIEAVHGGAELVAIRGEETSGEDHLLTVAALSLEDYQRNSFEWTRRLLRAEYVDPKEWLAQRYALCEGLENADSFTPLPEEYCGGYMYPDRTHGTLNGVPLEKARWFSKGGNEDASATMHLNSTMLEDAPCGSVYVCEEEHRDGFTTRKVFVKASICGAPAQWLCVTMQTL